MNAYPVTCRKPGEQRRLLPGVAGAIRAIVLAALAAVLLAPSSASAVTIGWCKSDPVVVIGPNVVDIVLSAPVDAPLKVTGPNEIVVMVPESVPVASVSLVGFGRGEVVSLVHSSDLAVTEEGIEVVVQAFVPATDSTMPVVLDFAPNVVGLLFPSSAQGFANSWITLWTVL